MLAAFLHFDHTSTSSSLLFVNSQVLTDLEGDSSKTNGLAKLK